MKRVVNKRLNIQSTFMGISCSVYSLIDIPLSYSFTTIRYTTTAFDRSPRTFKQLDEESFCSRQPHRHFYGSINNK